MKFLQVQTCRYPCENIDLKILQVQEPGITQYICLQVGVGLIFVVDIVANCESVIYRYNIYLHPFLHLGIVLLRIVYD